MRLSPRQGLHRHRALALTLGGALALATLAVPAVGADPDGRRDHRYDRRQQRHEHRYDDHRRRQRHDDRYDRYRGQRRDRYDYRYDYRYRDRYRYDSRYRGQRHFEVPRVIHDHRAYERYSYDRVYYRGHRHYHRIYRFPVYSEYGVRYEPYAYCDGRYFSRGAFSYDGPRFSIRWRF